MERRPGHERQRAAIDGFVAAAFGLAASFLASLAVPALEFPPLALADRIVRITPGSVATEAIDRLQHAALPLLGVGSIAGFLLLGAAIGRALRGQGGKAPWLAGAVFSAALAAAELTAPVSPPMLPALATAAGAGGVFSASLHWPGRLGGRRTGFDPGRRRALVELGAGAAALLVGGTALGRLIASPARAPVRGLRRPPTPTRPPFPWIEGLSNEVTSVASHYVVDIDLNDPVLDASDWSLSVEGKVGRRLDLGFEELQQRFALVGEYSVLTCISNRVGGPLVGNSLWQGVRLRDLVSVAEPLSEAIEVVFECADGYTAAIPLAEAMDASVIVAIAHNGRSLTREHGFPCRLRAPAFYGIKNPKWIERIVLVDKPFEGYWQRQGWTDSALVRLESRIDAPETAAAGEATWIAGIAWAGLRGIGRVEVSTDGGRTWRRAMRQRPLSRYAWTRWAYHWTPPRPGRYELVCRATDGDGRAQEPVQRPPHPSGASGYHRRTLEVT